MSHLLRASMAERPEVRAEPESEIDEERGCRGTGLWSLAPLGFQKVFPNLLGNHE